MWSGSTRWLGRSDSRADQCRERVLQHLADLRMDAPKVIDGSRLGPDPPGLVEDLAGDTGDAQQSLWIEGETRSRNHILGFGRAGRSGRAACLVVHRAEITAD